MKQYRRCILIKYIIGQPNLWSLLTSITCNVILRFAVKHDRIDEDTREMSGTQEKCRGHERNVEDTREMSRTWEKCRGHKRKVEYTREKSRTQEKFWGHEKNCEDTREISRAQEKCRGHDRKVEDIREMSRTREKYQGHEKKVEDTRKKVENTREMSRAWKNGGVVSPDFKCPLTSQNFITEWKQTSYRKWRDAENMHLYSDKARCFSQ